MEAPITIVSGLPRSGTSMLMQMLHAGGMPVLIDSVRTADTHNPKGYFEYEATKRLKHDQNWLPLAQNKAVKIVSHFIEHLPREHQYNVIFIRRNLDEVMSSQCKMLQGVEDAPDTEMKQLFEKHLRHVEIYLSEHLCFRTLYLDYADILRNPYNAIAEIDHFLGQSLDTGAMAVVVDVNLYRNRNEA